MESEIRVLEDQLYDADYQNRVLHDKLTQLEVQSQRVDSKSRPPKVSSPSPRLSPPPSETDPLLDPLIESPSMEEPDSLEEFGIPLVDEGVSDDEMAPPQTHRDPVGPHRGDDDQPDAGLLPPPGGPEPPGKGDLELPQIDPGELLPPASRDETENQRAGRVTLPKSLLAKTKPGPSTLEIHKGLSGGHQFDGDEDVGGMFLVINALDDRGRPVDLDRFDIDAQLTVVALDPTREPSEARIGRWEFTSNEVKNLVRKEPSSGLHVALRWQESYPKSDDVIIHVRLRAEDEEMRCEGRMKVGRSIVAATWTPRGDQF